MKKALDIRWLYILLFLSIIVPMARPLGLPLKMGTWTKVVWDTLDKLTPNDVLLICPDFNPSIESELGPQRDALIYHLGQKGVKAIFVTFVPQGTQQTKKFITGLEAAGRKYGTDLVDLGFLAGEETALAAFFGDMKKACPKDARGTATADIPLLKNINTARDVKLLIHFAQSLPGTAEYVRQLGPYGITFVECVSTGAMATSVTYVQSKQALGLIAGLQGAAEYEMLNKHLAYATTAMDSQSLAYTVFIGAVIAGNVIYYIERKRARTK